MTSLATATKTAITTTTTATTLPTAVVTITMTSVLIDATEDVTRATTVTAFVVVGKWLSRLQPFATPRTVACQAPPSMGFSRQGYWSGLPLPSPEDLPDRGIETGSRAL